MTALLNLLRTLLIGAVGVVPFRALGLPLPFLLGPLFACLVCALAGLRLSAYAPLTDAMRGILGVAVGASITPAVLGQIPAMALSLTLAPIFLLVAGAAGYPYMRRICGFDPATAFYAAMPGG
ncbi:membrane protein AbrB duplication [Jannaschia seosinensis]|uniref:Membrane protein AbrB duplication n=1 Tax=Jannaschia seosinensis TaxID=313367 RepID=A0A0M7BF49_9RHOB|nr:membrane protein AbrB duplication [Jannaschia seosinensis]